MTSEELKAAALELVSHIDEKINEGHVSISCMSDHHEVWIGKGTYSKYVELIVCIFQPLVDADRQKIERLEKALRFYADGSNYESHGAPGKRVGTSISSSWVDDFGDVARHALGEERQVLKTKDRIVSGSGDENRHEQ